MKSTFIAPDGSRLEVAPSPACGHVWLQLFRKPLPGQAEEFSRIIPVPLHLAGAVAQAIEATATLLEEACLRPELPAAALCPPCNRNCHQGRACPVRQAVPT